MGDGTVGVQQAASPDRLIDNETVTRGPDTVYRQRIHVPTLDARYRGGKIPVVGTATASGTTTIYTPTAGKAVRVLWVSAKPAPDATSYPILTITLGTRDLYRDYAIQHWEQFEGAVNETLKINLSQAGVIPWTVHLEEF